MQDVTNEEFFGEGLSDGPTPELTAKFRKAYDQLIEENGNVSLLEDTLKGHKDVVSKLIRDTLPNLLREMGSDMWKDPDTGRVVQLETAVNSTLPKKQEARNEILDALRPLGIEEILGEEFNVTFIPNDERTPVLRALLGLDTPDHVIEEETSSRLSNSQAEAVHKFRVEMGWDQSELPANEKLGVHPSRLRGWLKKQIDDGKGTEVTEAGIWHGKVAKVVEPKGGKK